MQNGKVMSMTKILKMLKT